MSSSCMHRSSFVGALVFIPRAFAALRTRGAFVFIQPPGNNGPPAICSTVANLINDFTILRRRAEEITAAALALDRRFLTGDRAGDLLRTGDRAGDLRTGDLAIYALAIYAPVICVQFSALFSLKQKIILTINCFG